jgi:hypothetical protein
VLPQGDKDALLSNIAAVLAGGLTVEALEKANKMLRLASLPAHGIESSYSRGCRCEACTRAVREATRARRKKGLSDGTR